MSDEDDKKRQERERARAALDYMRTETSSTNMLDNFGVGAQNRFARHALDRTVGDDYTDAEKEAALEIAREELEAEARYLDGLYTAAGGSIAPQRERAPVVQQARYALNALRSGRARDNNRDGAVDGRDRLSRTPSGDYVTPGGVVSRGVVEDSNGARGTPVNQGGSGPHPSYRGAEGRGNVSSPTFGGSRVGPGNAAFGAAAGSSTSLSSGSSGRRSGSSSGNRNGSSNGGRDDIPGRNSRRSGGWSGVGRPGVDNPNGGGNSGNSNSSGGGWGGGCPPIVVDLDDDGVELVAVEDSSVRFFSDGDGFKYRSGWAAADDGLLVYDKDNDGNITANDEVSFVEYVIGQHGEAEALRLYDGDSDGVLTDMEALHHFDSNNNGKLDAGDAEFSKFRIWKDADQDGVSDSGEVNTLAHHNLQDFTLSYNADSPALATSGGNTVHGLGSFTRVNAVNGSRTGTFGDVSFGLASVGVRKNAAGHYEYKFGNAIHKIFSRETATAAVSINFSSTAYRQYIGAIGGRIAQ